MNRNWIQSLIVVLAAGLVAFGVTRWQANAAGPNLDRMQSSDWLARELGLSAEQQTALGKLKGSYRDAMESCCERNCSVRSDLAARLFKSDWTEEQQKGLAEELAKSSVDTELATLNHIRQVYELLNPDQRKTYEALVEQCLCTSCPSGMHSKE